MLGCASAVLIVVATVAGMGVGRHETRIEVEGPDALEELVAAWERYRSGTFVVESAWSRKMKATDSTLESSVFLAQSPPDRVVIQHGATRGQLNGRPIFCGTGPEGDYDCTLADRAAPDHREELEQEVASWRSFAAGETPLYTFSWDGRDCFELTLADLAYPDPPYGTRSEICFDEETGALRLLRRELPTAVEEQRAVTIRTEVTAADLSLDRPSDEQEPFGGVDVPG